CPFQGPWLRHQEVSIRRSRRRPLLDAFGVLGRRLARPGFGESGDLCDEGCGVVSFGSKSPPIHSVSSAWRSCFGSIMSPQFAITEGTAAVLGRTAAARSTEQQRPRATNGIALRAAKLPKRS